MLRKVISYPNKNLYKKSSVVTKFDKKLFVLLDDMYDLMIEHKGIGLAAIQVDISYRVFILCLPDENDKQNKENLIEIINPEIVEKSGEIFYEEGCLSVPGFNADIKRYKDIKVKYYNRDNILVSRELTDLESIAFQHELDHLNGKLFVDHLNILKRKKFDKEYKRLLKEKSKEARVKL